MAVPTARTTEAANVFRRHGGWYGLANYRVCPIPLRIPTKPAMHSNSKPAGYSDRKPATRGVVRMGQFHDVVEGWEGQETG